VKGIEKGIEKADVDKQDAERGGGATGQGQGAKEKRKKKKKKKKKNNQKKNQARAKTQKAQAVEDEEALDDILEDLGIVLQQKETEATGSREWGIVSVIILPVFALFAYASTAGPRPIFLRSSAICAAWEYCNAFFRGRNRCKGW
jgi:hypothetical protein